MASSRARPRRCGGSRTSTPWRPGSPDRDRARQGLGHHHRAGGRAHGRWRAASTRSSASDRRADAGANHRVPQERQTATARTCAPACGRRAGRCSRAAMSSSARSTARTAATSATRSTCGCPAPRRTRPRCASRSILIVIGLALMAFGRPTGADSPAALRHSEPRDWGTRHRERPERRTRASASAAETLAAENPQTNRELACRRRRCGHPEDPSGRPAVLPACNYARRTLPC
jgi:hypothetical protein